MFLGFCAIQFGDNNVDLDRTSDSMLQLRLMLDVAICRLMLMLFLLIMFFHKFIYRLSYDKADFFHKDGAFNFEQASC